MNINEHIRFFNKLRAILEICAIYEEADVPNGYHYELQYLNGVWQWVLVADNNNKELIEWLWNK